MRDNDNSGFWGIVVRVGIVIGLIAGLVTIVGFFRSNPSAAVTGSVSQTGQVSSGDNSQPTATTATIPQAQPTATPVPAPPSAGTVVCQSGDWSGWTASGSWHIVNGMLVNDGSDNSTDIGPSVAPPSSCQPWFSDYAVQIVAQVVQPSGENGFGIDLRAQSTGNGWTGYAAYVVSCCGAISLGGLNDNYPAESNFDIGSSFHTYRAEVRGNSLKFIVDGIQELSVTDNRYLSPGQVGLFCVDGNQIQVRSFEIIAL